MSSMANSYQKCEPDATSDASSLVQIKMEYDEDEIPNDGTIVSYESTAKTENPEILDPPSEFKPQPGTLRVKPFAALAEVREQSRSVEPRSSPYCFNNTNNVRVKTPSPLKQALNPTFESSEPRHLASQLANNEMWLSQSEHPPELPNSFWPFLEMQSVEMYKRFNGSLNYYLNPGNVRQTQQQNSRAFPFNHHPEPVGHQFPHSEMTSPNVTTFPRYGLNQTALTQSSRSTNMPTTSRFLYEVPSGIRNNTASSSRISSEPSQHRVPIPVIKAKIPPPEDQPLGSRLNAMNQPDTLSETKVKLEVDLGVGTSPYNDENIKAGTSTQAGAHFEGKAFTNFQMLDVEKQKIPGELENQAWTNPSAKNCIEDLQLYPPHNPKGKYTCKACDYRTSKADGVKLHASVIHTSKNEFRCTHCYTKNESIHHLVHHFAKIHRNEKRWQCQKCGRSYTHKSSYLTHKNTKCIVIDPYACHKCIFTCKSEETLQKHILNHMKDLKLPCQYCGKEVKHRALETHIAVIHGGDKKFKCQECDFASATKGYLKVHYKKTRHDKPFSCQRCNFRSATAKGLDTHLDAHKKQAGQKYVCEHEGCGQVLTHHSSIKKHKKLHSLPKDRLFICQFDKCGEMYDNLASLRLHYGRTKHHRPYQCPKCVNRFIKESSCIKHYKVYHEMKELQQQQMIAEMNEATGTSCEKSEEDAEEARVCSFGMWLGISGFGSEFEADVGDDPYSTTGGPVSTLTADTDDAILKSESDGGTQRAVAVSLTEIPENLNDSRVEVPGDALQLSKDDCPADSSELPTAELTENASMMKFSCVPDISDLLECKIESIGNESDVNLQSGEQEVNNELTKIGCLVEIKQEIKPDEENITDDEIEGETVKTEEDTDNLVSVEVDPPFYPSRFVMQK